jgi:hypothetical protein
MVCQFSKKILGFQMIILDEEHEEKNTGPVDISLYIKSTLK